MKEMRIEKIHQLIMDQAIVHHENWSELENGAYRAGHLDARTAAFKAVMPAAVELMRKLIRLEEQLTELGVEPKE